MRWCCALVLIVGCSGGTEPSATSHSPSPATSTAPEPSTAPSIAPAPSTAPEPSTAPQPSTAPEPDAIALHFDWPAPAEADVRVTSEHDFSGTLVSASYHYRLAVRRDDDGFHVTRTGIALESHEGTERLRLGNVLVQDVTQHAGELRLDADGTHIVALGGFDPVESAARSVLADAGMEGPLAEAVLSLGHMGWETLNVVDYDTMIHEWNGRSFVLGVIQPADATGGVSATRILSRAAAPCDESAGALATCVELVRTEQGEQANDRVEHVYTLLAEPDTLRPHRFQHESRTDSEAASVHYAETWTTTFTWQ